MAKRKLEPSSSYLLIFGALALISVRFLKKDFNSWGSIDYFIGVVCVGTIILAMLTLIKDKLDDTK